MKYTLQNFTRYSFFCAVFLCLFNFSKAQKNTAVVANSSLTGLPLPPNSKKDSRGLFVNAAKAMFTIEAKDAGTSVNATEVFYLPLVSNFTIDSVIANLTNLQWAVTPLANDNDYAWLQKDGRNLIAYYKKDKNAINLYFGELTSAPSGMQQMNNTENNIMQNQQNQQSQQTEQQDIQQNNFQQTETQQQVQQALPVSNGYTFNTTNFDDGWVAIVQEDWVEVSKGGIKVLVHHPNQKADEYRPNKNEADLNAWNVLVSHRYNSLTNFFDRGLTSMPSITFLTGDAVDNITGEKKHIVLYRRHDWNGPARYIEVVAGNQAAFEAEFGNNYINTSSWNTYDQAESWNKIAAMQTRNRFAIATSDLVGKWGSTQYASISYYYVSTGLSAGATATSLADQFTFSANNKYESDHSGASGEVGNMKFSRVVYKGNSSVNNWDITLTNRFQGETEKFDCYFEAVKGGRALIMKDKNNYQKVLVKVN